MPLFRKLFPAITGQLDIFRNIKDPTAWCKENFTGYDSLHKKTKSAMRQSYDCGGKMLAAAVDFSSDEAAAAPVPFQLISALPPKSETTWTCNRMLDCLAVVSVSAGGGSDSGSDSGGGGGGGGSGGDGSGGGGGGGGSGGDGSDDGGGGGGGGGGGDGSEGGGSGGGGCSKVVYRSKDRARSFWNRFLDALDESLSRKRKDGQLEGLVAMERNFQAFRSGHRVAFAVLDALNLVSELGCLISRKSLLAGVYASTEMDDAEKETLLLFLDKFYSYVDKHGKAKTHMFQQRVVKKSELTKLGLQAFNTAAAAVIEARAAHTAGAGAAATGK